VLSQPPEPAAAGPRMTFRFLCSPKEIKPGPDGRIQRLVVTENLLVPKGDGTAAKATDRTAELDVDTMIFAIGDVHDPSVGLPMGPEGYSTKPDPTDPRSIYQLCDPQSGAPIVGSYVVGWARKASEGLVGIARHDAEVGAGYVLTYLETAAERPTASPAEIQRALLAKGIAVVAKPDLELLTRAEEKQARQRGIPFFKFSDDRDMLRAIEEERTASLSLGISSGRD
jgi:ferredoxin--NADP+ reductase